MGAVWGLEVTVLLCNAALASKGQAQACRFKAEMHISGLRREKATFICSVLFGFIQLPNEFLSC